MQIERLFGIVYILLSKRTVTARELADRFEVSTRTIYRDIDTLSGSGIPIFANKGKGGGIGLIESYVLNKSLFSEEEQREILSALSCLNTVAFSDAGQILSKMSGLFHRDPYDWIDIDFTDWSHSRGETFALLKNAILDNNVLAFDYHNAMGEVSRRSVEPRLLWFKHRAWYLKGFCRMRGDTRLFRISRMRNIELTGESCRDRPMTGDNPVESYHSNLRSPIVHLKIRIDKALSYRVYDEFDDSMFTRDSRGDYIVTADYPEDEWVYGFLMSFGPYLEVLEPGRVKNILADRLRNTLRLYTRGQINAKARYVRKR